MSSHAMDLVVYAKSSSSSSWPQRNCESSLGSSGECRTAPSGRRPSDQATWLNWAVSPPVGPGCKRLQPPSLFTPLHVMSMRVIISCRCCIAFNALPSMLLASSYYHGLLLLSPNADTQLPSHRGYVYRWHCVLRCTLLISQIRTFPRPSHKVKGV